MRPNTLQDILAKLEPITETGCFIYSGRVREDGYCPIKVKGKDFYIHLYIYEQLIGPIPLGYEIDHLCKVRCCANPLHLEAVSPHTNKMRSDCPAALNARRTHCKNGHLFVELFNGGKGRRQIRRCRICRRKQERDRWQRDKLAGNNH